MANQDWENYMKIKWSRRVMIRIEDSGLFPVLYIGGFSLITFLMYVITNSGFLTDVFVTG
jgi:hypothetical protein